MKTYCYHLMQILVLIGVFFTQVATASEIKFATVTLTLLEGSEKIIDSRFVVEIGKTGSIQNYKKNVNGSGTLYRADFTIDSAYVNESGNAIGMSSLRLFKLDNDKKQWVMEREQKMGIRLNNIAAKISLSSPAKNAPQAVTIVSILQTSQAEAML